MADEVLAPELLIPELVNVIWKYRQFENWDIGSCEEALQEGIALVDSLVSCRALHHEAFLLARTTRKPAYDMFYLALARREGASLLTVDGSTERSKKTRNSGIVNCAVSAQWVQQSGNTGNL